MNKVILIGRVATDPEYAQTTGGVARTTFRLAVPRKYKNNEGKYDADFFTVISWRGTADLAKLYLAKGDRCGVVGSLQNRSWTGNDGVNHHVTEVIADEIDFLNSRQDREQSNGQPVAEQTGNQEYRPQTGQQQSAFQQGFTPVDDDDELPF